MTTDATPARSRLAELGPNAGLIDEMYRLYRENPNAVSAGWREFFADYQPRADVAAPAPAATPRPPRRRPRRAADGRRHHAPPVTLDGESPEPLRGASAAHRREHGGEPRGADRHVGARAARPSCSRSTARS